MNDVDVLFQVTYGSKLYGTSTPTSDTDLKSVYLPRIDDLLLGRKMSIFKERVDADGNHVDSQSTMPDNGVENEFFPFQTFVRDFVQGQTYALEMAYAIKYAGPSAPDAQSVREYNLVIEMIEQFGNAEVYSMVSFAMKQTFDYVRRGERLVQATALRDHLNGVLSEMLRTEPDKKVRLDSQYNPSMKVLDVVAQRTGLPLGSSENNNRPQRTLEMNGRSYLESTELSHLINQVSKQIAQYGDRTTKASETDVDFKSLSHAVRVYQQAIELLTTGEITFPRPNAVYLLEVKQGKADLEEVKGLLTALDFQVLDLLQSSTQRRKTPELVAASEQWLLEVLRELYCLN